MNNEKIHCMKCGIPTEQNSYCGLCFNYNGGFKK